MTIAETIARQERELTFDRFDEDTAWTMGCWIVERGRAGAWPIVVDIRLFHRTLFFAALAGSVPDNVEWARRKRNVVERYHRSSYGVGQDMAAKGTTLAARYGLPLADFAEHGGAFPIALAACGVAGCITISGLPQVDDHMLVVRAICAATGRDAAAYAFPDVP